MSETLTIQAPVLEESGVALLCMRSSGLVMAAKNQCQYFKKYC